MSPRRARVVRPGLGVRYFETSPGRGGWYFEVAIDGADGPEVVEFAADDAADVRRVVAEMERELGGAEVADVAKVIEGLAVFLGVVLDGRQRLAFVDQLAKAAHR